MQKDACALDQIETPPTLSGDEKEEIVNPFDKVEQSVLGTLQDVLDERNENTEEGAKKYSKVCVHCVVPVAWCFFARV